MSIPEFQYSQVDSHSSQYNNKRIIDLFAVADTAALNMTNNTTIFSVNAYFSCLEQIFINTKDVIINRKVQTEIEEIRTWVYNMQFNLLSKEALRTQQNLFRMAYKCRTFNSLIITGLQDQKFFFRTATQSKKGLDTIAILDDTTIFKEDNTKNENNKES